MALGVIMSKQSLSPNSLSLCTVGLQQLYWAVTYLPSNCASYKAITTLINSPYRLRGRLIK